MTDTEREAMLLEDAASVAGLTITRDGDGRVWLPTEVEWNPLNYSGDAFALACRLQLNIDYREERVRVYADYAPGQVEEWYAHYPNDAQGLGAVEAAARHAVVKAAARLKTPNAEVSR